MKKLYAWCKENILFLCTLFLLAFIPLYPKLPLVDIKHVWVYIRAEDFVVLFVFLCWGILLVRKKLTLQTPLTLPILIFWFIGAVATMHGILLIFPGIADVFPNVAFLSFLRRIEYMSLFFISYSAMRDKRFLSYVVAVLTVTLFAVIGYGIGQKYLYFPAFLTMNEEFAKGMAIQLSSLSRLSSTFAGHYDLAAYLVLVIPIMISLIFGYRSWLVRVIFLAASLLGLFILFMTVSRISLFALFVSLGLVLVFQKKKFVIFLFPIAATAVVLLLSFSPSMLERFGNTIKEIDVLVDAKTGDTIGYVKEVPNGYFENKIIKQQFSRNIKDLDAYASPAAALVIPNTYLPEKVLLLVEPDAPTGEDLPQGTGYINLSLSPITHRLGNFYYERKPNPQTGVIEVLIINGDYLVKRALAYDLSFTTRFQGEWPRALTAFKRNILFGSGYGSVSLAVDNSYLRMLAEVGLLGLGTFLAIFIMTGMYIRKVLPDVDNTQTKSFAIGVVAGTAGLLVNALFIDVFEASKVAFLLWILVGVALRVLHSHQRRPLALYKEFMRVVTSAPAIIVYLFILTFVLYWVMTRNNFVGDDFTWLRWAADCPESQTARCRPSVLSIASYFTQSQGFFYRPGAKLYFLFMYTAFWLNQAAYHAVSLLLHGTVTALIFLLAKRVLKRSLSAVAAALFFLLFSGYSEAIHWISATGFLFTATFSLLALLFSITWTETKKTAYFGATLLCIILSLLFHELGIATPFLILLYRSIFTEGMTIRRLVSDTYHKLLLLPLPVYLVIRAFAQSHWLSGDYSYNIMRLPFNVIGNTIGYIALTVFGPLSLPLTHWIRSSLRGNIAVATIIAVLAGLVLWRVILRWHRFTGKEDRRIVLFGFGFFLLTLAPFLGLGNISSRYSYLSSVGTAFLLVVALKYFWAFLVTNGRTIAVLGMATILGTYGLLQIIQNQQIHSDWYQAGETSRRFIVSMDSLYEDTWTSQPVELHFVKVPIRSGEAWIFPVGITDALWLKFRNPNMRVFVHATREEAFASVGYDAGAQKVLEFDESGKVTEYKKPLITQ